MNMTEVRKAFSKALSRLTLPEILLPSLVIDGLHGALGAVLAINVSRKVLESPVPRGEVAGEMVLVALFGLLLAPAILSGLYSVSRAVVVNGRGKWSDFRSGLWTYWWRLVGLALLGSLAVTIGALILGVKGADMGFGQLPDFNELMRFDTTYPLFVVLYLVGRYLVSPVVPAMVIEQTPAVKAIELGTKFAARNASSMVPAVALDLVVAWVLQWADDVTGNLLDVHFGFQFGRFLPNLAVLLLMALVSAFFRLLYLGIYYDNLPNHPLPLFIPDSPVGAGLSEDAVSPEAPRETGGAPDDEKSGGPQEVEGAEAAGDPGEKEGADTAGDPAEKEGTEEPGEAEKPAIVRPKEGTVVPEKPE